MLFWWEWFRIRPTVGLRGDRHVSTEGGRSHGKKRDTKPEERKPQESASVSRRDFIKRGMAAGVGAAALGGCATTPSRKRQPPDKWDYEVDVLVIGAGCSGLPCAIRARDAGLNVLVIDQNFDVGGKTLHSGGQVSLGGGDPCQLRDIAGQGDKEGFLKVAPLHKPEDMKEDTDFLFRDITDWSVLDVGAQAPYRYNDREMHRAWADNCPATRQFLMDNYVRFTRIQGTHPTGGISRARRATTFLMLGDKTDIKAGTVTRQDAGIAGQELEPLRAALHGERGQVGRARRGLERRRSHARPGVQRAGERRPVHAQPENDRDRPRAAILGTGAWASRRATPRGSIRAPRRIWKAIGRTATSTSAALPSPSGRGGRS